MWAKYVKIEATRSFVFLPPFININKHYVINDSLNVYFGDRDKPAYNHHIFILFQKNTDINYETRRDSVMTSSLYFLEKYSPKRGLIMYLYAIPDEYQEDYEMFRMSKYSLLSTKAKKTILKYHGMGPMDLLFKNLYKTEDRKQELENRFSFTDDGYPLSKVYLSEDAEYMSLLNEEEEIFNVDTLEELKKSSNNREKEGIMPM